MEVYFGLQMAASTTDNQVLEKDEQNDVAGSAYILISKNTGQ
jgi:hypothetical protein